MTIKITVSTPDLRRTERAFRGLERDARKVADDAGQDIARELAATIRAFAGTRGRQTARAAQSVEVVGGSPPKVTAGGGGGLAADLTLGTEFGATRRFGWYRKGRYHDSRGKQFPPHRGSSSYWFFRTYEAEREAAILKYGRALDDIIREWGSGG